GHRPTSTSAPGGAHHDLDEAVRGHERRLDEDAGRPLRGELLRPDLLDGASMLQVRDVDDGLSDVGPGEPGGRERAPHADEGLAGLGRGVAAGGFGAAEDAGDEEAVARADGGAEARG